MTVVCCPKCGEKATINHPKHNHMAYACGYSTGHGTTSTPCEGNGPQSLQKENAQLKETLAVAKKCMEEAVATNEKVREERDELTQIVAQRNTAIDALNEEVARVQGINKTLTEQSAALADANLKLVQENSLIKLDLRDAEKQLASMQRRIDAQAETIAATHEQKPSFLGWLFCD